MGHGDKDDFSTFSTFVLALFNNFGNKNTIFDFSEGFESVQRLCAIRKQPAFTLFYIILFVLYISYQYFTVMHTKCFYGNNAIFLQGRTRNPFLKVFCKLKNKIL